MVFNSTFRVLTSVCKLVPMLTFPRYTDIYHFEIPYWTLLRMMLLFHWIVAAISMYISASTSATTFSFYIQHIYFLHSDLHQNLYQNFFSLNWYYYQFSDLYNFLSSMWNICLTCLNPICSGLHFWQPLHKRFVNNLAIV